MEKLEASSRDSLLGKLVGYLAPASGSWLGRRLIEFGVARVAMPDLDGVLFEEHEKVLQIFARTMRAGLRQSDLIGRLGGEEFTVVLADAGVDNAYLVADRLRRTFAVSAAVVDGEAVHATASIGVSVIVDPSQDLARLITLADQALYLAKARGRNRVEVAPIEVQEDGLRHSVKIGDAVDFEVEDIVPFGSESGEPVRVTISKSKNETVDTEAKSVRML